MKAYDEMAELQLNAIIRAMQSYSIGSVSLLGSQTTVCEEISNPVIGTEVHSDDSEGGDSSGYTD